MLSKTSISHPAGPGDAAVGLISVSCGNATPMFLCRSGSKQCVPTVTLLAPQDDTTEFPYGRLAQSVFRRVSEQDLLLNVGRQLQQIHDLGDARTRDLAQVCQLPVILYGTFLNHLFHL